MPVRASARAANRILRRLGLEIRRVRRDRPHRNGAIPPLLEDAESAWHFERVGHPAAFPCALSDCVNSNGFNYAIDGWDPFVMCAREFIADAELTFETSVLARYYDAWQPRDAAEATLCFAPGEPPLGGRPSHLFALYPWLPDSFEEFDAYVRSWVRRDNEEHGHATSSIEREGYKVHGPVSHAVGQLEFRRLTQLVSSIRMSGYDRAHGDVFVIQVRDGSESRFIEQGGMHRMAAMTALGHDSIPARLLGVFDVSDVAYWPGVRLGRWTARQARRYVRHLFEFDPHTWAEEASFIDSACTTRPTIP